MTAAPARHRFTAAQFAQMGEAGVFDTGARLELIRGEVIEMSPIGRRHAACVRRLVNLLSRALGTDGLIDAQNPVLLDELSQPQPDLVVLRPRADYYSDGHPGSDDILLLIEVADSSLDYDRGVKVPLYARCGVIEVWLLDLDGRAIHVHRDPSPDGTYAHVERIADPATVLAPRALPRLAQTVTELLGAGTLG